MKYTLLNNQYPKIPIPYTIKDYDKAVADVKSNPTKLTQDEFDAIIATNQYLLDELPINQSITLLGAKDLPPSDFEKSIWLRKYYIAKNKDQFKAMLNGGQIGLLEINIMNQLYPDLLAETRNEIVQELINYKVKYPDKDLSIKTEYILMVLFETLTIDNELLAAHYSPDKKEGSIDSDPNAVKSDVQQFETKGK
jgi:hypothetical protein